MAAMKRRLLIILIAAIMVFALGLAGSWWNDRLGDLSLGNRGIARRYGMVSFDPIRWQAADKAERGRMVLATSVSFSLMLDAAGSCDNN
jgi:hypothetical protein